MPEHDVMKLDDDHKSVLDVLTQVRKAAGGAAHDAVLPRCAVV